MKISIGIPAYNEEANIKTLLEALLAQREDGFTLQEIIVVLDGSTDNTLQEIKEVNDKRIIVKDDRKRLGKSERLNQIFSLFTGDILFLMDADITIRDDELLVKVINKSDFQKDGLVTVNALPLPARTYFERILESGVVVLKDIVKNWNHGNNYLSFKGCFLSLDKKFAKSIHMPQSLINNDGYIYFAALEQDYTPRYIPELEVYYKSPANFKDHLKQTSRFHSSPSELTQYFSTNIKKDYHFPTFFAVKSTIKHLFLQPQYLVPYIVIMMLTKVMNPVNMKSTWSIASSTK